jgi:hypothetical protein
MEAAVEVVLAQYVLEQRLGVVDHALVEQRHREEGLEQRVLGLRLPAAVDLGHGLLEAALVREDARPVEGHDHEVPGVHLEQPVVG